MAGFHPPAAEGSPPSYASMVRADIHEPTLKTGSQYKGEPALFYSQVEVQDLSGSLHYALVGKFSHGRPPMEFISRGFQTIGFKGSYRLSLLDPQHILIRFDYEEDFHRCWLHECWNFKKHIMKVLKWTSSFSVTTEPPVVPIWISLENLPLFVFKRGPLFSIGNLLGRSLKIDQATANLTHLSTARVCMNWIWLAPFHIAFGLARATWDSGNQLPMKIPLPHRLWLRSWLWSLPHC